MRLFGFAPFLIAVPILASCNILSWFSGPPGPASTTGDWSGFAETSYNDNCVITSNQKPNPTDILNEFQKDMKAQNQVQRTVVPDNVMASQMVAAEKNSDWLWFSGHGDPGLMELYWCETGGNNPDITSWGPGSTTNQYPSNTNGFPVQGQLKWILAFSSDTVALPPSFVPSNYADYGANWSIAFGGSLHGLYGFYQTSGTCPFSDPGFTGGGVTCDIYAFQGPSFADDFTSHALGSTPVEDVHSSWANAANDVSFGDRWSMYEYSGNDTDILAGGSTDPGPSGVVTLYYANAPIGVDSVTPVTPGNGTFTLNPTTLNPEPLSDTTLLSNAQPYFGSPDSYSNNGTISVAAKGGTTIRHYLASSALSYHGVYTNNALTFTQASALSDATQAAQGVNGMPADAVLTETALQWEGDPVSGGETLTGYLFTWKHAASIASSDAIRVAVTDYQTSSQVCTGGTKYFHDPPNPPITLCLGYTTYYTDQPNIAYMFRMWHTVAGVQSVQSLGKASITAATAAASLPAGSVIVAYAPGNWSPSFDNASPNIATPAWVFTLAGGVQVYVDAYTGQVLGNSAD
jgi:hypothetical protein